MRTDDWSLQLVPGEHVVWQGAPKQGYHFRTADVPLVLIVRTWPTHRRTSINLRTVGEISLQEHRDGTGTISFGGPFRSPMMQLQWGHHAAPAFEFIADAHQVMALAHGAAAA